MLRQAGSRLLRSGSAVRPTFSYSPKGLTAQRKFASPAGGGDYFSLSFVTPYGAISSKEEVSLVTVPGEEGQFGICANHLPTLAQLRPGVVEIQGKEKTRSYFISPGFVVVHPDATCHISATEAIPVEELDKRQAEVGLEEAKRKLASASAEAEKAEYQIAVDTYEAIVASC